MEQKKMQSLLDTLVGKNPEKIRAMISLLEGLLEETQPDEGGAGSIPVDTDENPVALESAITYHLLQLGVPGHLKGYKYLKASIAIAVKNQFAVVSIHKNIYAKVAEQFETTRHRVERTMRHAIEMSWDRVGFKVFQEYFGNSISAEKGKPKNNEFIATLADKIRLEQKA